MEKGLKVKDHTPFLKKARDGGLVQAFSPLIYALKVARFLKSSVAR